MTQLPETIDAMTQVNETLAQADQAVDDALARTDATVGDTLARADQTVNDALAGTNATLDETLARADQTVNDALAGTNATLDETLARADQTVNDAVARADATVDDALARADRTVEEALADGNQTVAAQAGGAAEGGEAMAGGSPPAAGAEGAVTPKGGDASLSGADNGAAAGPSATSHDDLTGAASPDGLFGDLPLWSQPFAESLATGPPAHGPVAAATPPTADVGSGLDGIVTSATDPRVMTAAGVAVLVGGGLGIWRGGPQLADASVMFTNLRLLPCMIRDGLADHAGALAAAVSRRGPEVAAQIAVPPPQGAAEATAMNPPVVTEHVGRGTLTRFGASFHEGFGQGVRGAREIPDTVADRRLLIQLGIGFGYVYALFLSVWFWATRLRRNSNA